LWTAARSAQTAARLLVLVGAFVLLVAPRASLWRRAVAEQLNRVSLAQLSVLLVTPTLIGLLAAASVFALSRHAVAREYGFNEAQRAVLTLEQPSLIQRVPPITATLNGLLLNVMPGESSTLPSELQACILVSGGEHCARGALMGNSYGFRLPTPVVLYNQPVTVAFQLAEPAANTRVVLPVASLPAARRPQDFQLLQPQVALTGHVVRMTLLRSFDPGQALTEVSARLTQDWRLFVVWPLVVMVFVFSVSQTIRASFKKSSSKKSSSGSNVQPLYSSGQQDDQSLH
jgi:hypothetical protein